MKIQAVACSFPERIVSNEEVLARIESTSSASLEPGSLRDTLDVVSLYLKYTGIETRRWLSPGESPFTHVETAVSRCLNQAGLAAAAVDALIFASVDRRVLEPAESYLIAKALGMDRTQCFDIMESCNGWSRAAYIVQTLLRARAFRNVLVVTSEFAAHEGEWITNSYRLTSHADLDWAFPSYTLGESASATLLSADDDNPWEFDFRSLPQFAELCIAPIDDYGDEIMRMGSTSKAGLGGRRFVSYGRRLHEAGLQVGLQMLAKYRELKGEVKIVLPHSQSRRGWVGAARALELEVPFYFVYPKYGNLITGSVPCALSLAVDERRVERGDKVFAVVTAAGLSLASYIFRY